MTIRLIKCSLVHLSSQFTHIFAINEDYLAFIAPKKSVSFFLLFSVGIVLTAQCGVKLKYPIYL